MKPVMIYIGVCFLVTVILVYQVTNPVQSEFVITNYNKDRNTLVSFNIPTKTFVRFAVYDVNGKEITSLINEELEAGLHNVNVNDEKLSDEACFYKLTAGNFVNIKKIASVNSSRENLSYK